MVSLLVCFNCVHCWYTIENQVFYFGFWDWLPAWLDLQLDTASVKKYSSHSNTHFTSHLNTGSLYETCKCVLLLRRTKQPAAAPDMQVFNTNKPSVLKLAARKQLLSWVQRMVYDINWREVICTAGLVQSVICKIQLSNKLFSEGKVFIIDFSAVLIV